MIFSLYLGLIRFIVDYVSLVQSHMQLFILQCEKGNNTRLILTEQFSVVKYFLFISS